MPSLAELRDKYTNLGSELSNVASLAGMSPPSPQRKYLVLFTAYNSAVSQSIKFIISVAHCRLDFTINSSIQI